MIKAIVFDFDGLIVDTETPSYSAFQTVYRSYGLELPLSEYARCIGTSFEQYDPYMQLMNESGADRDSLKTAFKREYGRLLEQVGLRPGVEAYLHAAKRLDLKVGLASSSALAWIEPYLNKHGLLRYFDTMQTADLVNKVKPDPELYLRALAALGVSGNEAVAFEDSLNGLKAAKAAGLKCVVVPNDVTRHFSFETQDLVIPSMADMELEEVIGLLKA